MTRPSLSNAQHRMLGRIHRSPGMKCSRFRPETATLASLSRKGCIVALDSFWTTTPRGREVYAMHGKSPATANV